MVPLQCSCLRDLSSIHSRHVTLVLGLHLQCCGLEYCGLGLSCSRTLVQSVLYRQSEDSASTLTRRFCQYPDPNPNSNPNTNPNSYPKPNPNTNPILTPNTSPNSNPNYGIFDYRADTVQSITAQKQLRQCFHMHCRIFRRTTFVHWNRRLQACLVGYLS